MSSGQKARTRDNFPRMKDRAYGRRKRAQRHAAALSAVHGLDAWSKLGSQIVDGFVALGNAAALAAQQMGEVIVQFIREFESAWQRTSRIDIVVHPGGDGEHGGSGQLLDGSAAAVPGSGLVEGERGSDGRGVHTHGDPERRDEVTETTDEGIPFDDVTGASCPSCGYQFDAATAVGSEQVLPTDGDYSICIKCGEPAVWYTNDGGELRTKLSDDPIPEPVADISARVKWYNGTRNG